jgi:predicted NAD/FAD-binding protein
VRKPIPLDLLIQLNSLANFTAALDDLHIVRTHALNSISVSRDLGQFEWASSTIFAQWSNFVRPSFWRMLFDIVRFNTFAIDVLLPDREGPMESIGDYLERERYSKQFRTDYLLPVTASVWANDVEQCRQEFPVGTLIRFM